MRATMPSPSRGLFQVIYGPKWKRARREWLDEQRELPWRTDMHSAYRRKKRGHK